MAMSPVLAAGVGVRHGWTWALRTASFRMDAPTLGQSGFGIATNRPGAASAIAALLAGNIRPSYGELRVLGQDMASAQGRAAVRSRVGLAQRSGLLWPPGTRVRGLIEHAARLAQLPGCDHQLLTAAILDRLGLTPWAQVPLRAVPALIAAQARLAAAAVHEPELLIIEGLLDGLSGADPAALAARVRDLGRDTAIVAVGCQASTLALACDEVIIMTDGIIVRPDQSALP
jgi:ABC-2 type transport system ATP-binding protein